MGSCFSKSKGGDAVLSYDASINKNGCDFVPIQLAQINKANYYNEMGMKHPLHNEARDTFSADGKLRLEPPNIPKLLDFENRNAAIAKDFSRQAIEQHSSAKKEKFYLLSPNPAAVSDILQDNMRCTIPFVNQSSVSVGFDFEGQTRREFLSNRSAVRDSSFASLVPSVEQTVRTEPPFQSLHSCKFESCATLTSPVPIPNHERNSLERQAITVEIGNAVGHGDVRTFDDSPGYPPNGDPPEDAGQRILTVVGTNNICRGSVEGFESSNSLSWQVSSENFLFEGADSTTRLTRDPLQYQTLSEMVPDGKLGVKSRRSRSHENFYHPGGVLFSLKTTELTEFKDDFNAERNFQVLYSDGPIESKSRKTYEKRKNQMNSDSLSLKKFQPAKTAGDRIGKGPGNFREAFEGTKERGDHYNIDTGTICNRINHGRKLSGHKYEKTSQRTRNDVCNCEKHSFIKVNYPSQTGSNTYISAPSGNKHMELRKEEADENDTSNKLEKLVASNSSGFLSMPGAVGNLETLTDPLYISDDNTSGCIIRPHEMEELLDSQGKTDNEKQLANGLSASDVEAKQEKFMSWLIYGTERDLEPGSDMALPSNAPTFASETGESYSETFNFNQDLSRFTAESAQYIAKEGFASSVSAERDEECLHLFQSDLTSGDRERTLEVFESEEIPITAEKSTENSSVTEFSIPKKNLSGVESVSRDRGEWDLQLYIQQGLQDTNGAVGPVNQLSVVSTGDALLFASSNPGEIHLRPSKPLVVNLPSSISPKTAQLAQEDSNIVSGKFCGEFQQEPAINALTIDDIILLLENDELDEEDLLSLLITAKSSCQESEVGSEASFEFKVRSVGSTPHSTPSTPMLSAGSTPRHIGQLTPTALTPEEIAEIWGVFESSAGMNPRRQHNGKINRENPNHYH